MKSDLWHGLWSKLSVLNIPQRYDGSSNRIINFHSIGECGPEPISKQDFEDIIKYILKKYEITELENIRQISKEKKVALTFDDGCENFITEVVPLLEKYEIPATVFVIAGSVCDDRFEKPKGLECDLLDGSQLRDLNDHRLVTIGNHSKTHPDLTNVCGSKLYEEICHSKVILEEYVDSVEYFAYPYGSYDDECISMVNNTHSMGFATGLNTVESSSEYAIPRFNGARSISQLSWCFSDMVGKSYSLYERTSI